MNFNSQQSKEPHYHTHRFKAMGGPCEIHYLTVKEKSNSFNTLLENEVRRLESKYSRYLSHSVTSQINRAHQSPLQVDEETAGLLNYAAIAFQQSDGLFDITSGVLRSVWDFKKEIVPLQKQVEKVLKNIGWDKVLWDSQGRRIQLKPNMEIDFGGLVKEYAADCVASLARDEGIESGYVNLGGDISIIGAKITDQGELPWLLGIRDPDQPDKVKATISVLTGGLASSGDYERFFVKNNHRYCHIFNPTTGWPCEGVAGVSVLSANCLTAGTLTTIAMLKGFEKGKVWLESNEVEFLIFAR